MNAPRSWRLKITGKGAMFAIALLAALMGFGLPMEPARADVGQIRQLMAQQQFEQAHDKVLAELAVKPKDGRLRLLYGVILGNTGQLDQAVTVFKDLLDDQPGDPQVLNNLAAIYAEQGDFRSAEDMLARAVLLSPQYSVARSNLGDLYASMARAQYHEALRTDPSNPQLLMRISALDQMFGAPAAVAAASPVQVPLASSGPDTVTAQQRTSRLGLKPESAASPNHRLSNISTKPVVEVSTPKVRRKAPEPAKGRELVSRCFAVGPFLKQAALRSTQIWLQSRMARVKEVQKQERRVVHTVYLPTDGTMEGGKAAKARLRDLGFHDVSLIRSGDLVNRVSLGVFRSEDSVRRRLAQMAKKGLEAKVETKTHESQRAWLRVLPDSAAAVDITALSQRFSKREPTHVQLESDLCP